MTTLRHAGWPTLALALTTSCSVNPAGLSPDAAADFHAAEVPAADRASFEVPLVSGGGGQAAPAGPAASMGAGGEGVGGTGGDDGVPGAGVGGGAAGAPETGGHAGTGGGPATGETLGTGGAVAGTGGAAGTFGGASGGRPGTGGASSGGGSGTGGEAATGGIAGGTGGRGAGGAPATGGSTGGDPGRTVCERYLAAQAFLPPGDDRPHCYWFCEDKQSWPAARASCQAEGGDLATILSKQENDFLRSVARFTTDAELWIGGTDERPGTDRTGAGTYRWTTNEPWGYTNWNRGTPLQPDGYCDPIGNGQPSTCDHRLTFAADGTWYDFWQDNPRGFLCEATP